MCLDRRLRWPRPSGVEGSDVVVARVAEAYHPMIYTRKWPEIRVLCNIVEYFVEVRGA